MAIPLAPILYPIIKEALSGVFGDKAVDKVDKAVEAITGKISADKAAINAIADASDNRQHQLNLIESKKKDRWASGWRPACGWICVCGVGWMFIGEPFFTAIVQTLGLEVVVPKIHGDMLFELLFALLGMAGIRSFDKMKGTAR